ncbi:MAG: hypothetical protein DBY45_01015 [Clostridiales bacterium]|nr:MAG: hypothetical protein DBY45_10740 [Clostridiales bacterium]PWL47317.1 MAG: hypothetical protein DBY45_01015 [Clostridiales bacterium]
MGHGKRTYGSAGGYPLRRRRRRNSFFGSATIVLAVLLCGTAFSLLLWKGPSLMAKLSQEKAQGTDAAAPQDGVGAGAAGNGSDETAGANGAEDRGLSVRPEPLMGAAGGASAPESGSKSEEEVSVFGAPATLKDTTSEEEPVDDSYFDDAAFIGDSRTQGLMLYTGLSNATFYTAQGLMVDTFFTKKVIGSGENKLTIPDAMKQKTFGKVYIMLGVNELGWSYEDVFIQKYGELVDEVKKLQPEATIFIQSILPVSEAKSSRDKIYNNPKIDRYNQLIQKMAEDKGAKYLNVSEAVGLDGGALPAEASTDGVHLNKEYCFKWLDYLKSHTGL